MNSPKTLGGFSMAINIRCQKCTSDIIIIPSLNRLIKSWTGAINLKGKYGTHTLRKTWGYIQRTVFCVPIEKITQRYLHSSPVVTMGYLGLQTQEVEDILVNNAI